MDEFINGKKVEVVETPKEFKSPVSDTSKETREVAHELSMRPYREFFNIEGNGYDQKLEEIIKWAKPNGKVSLDEALQKLSNLESKLGTPNLGEGKLDSLYRRVKILQSLGAIADGVF
jgi:hypothetical protein